MNKAEWDTEFRRDIANGTTLTEMMGKVCNSIGAHHAFSPAELKRIEQMRDTLTECMLAETMEQQFNFRMLLLTINNDFLDLQMTANDAIMEKVLDNAVRSGIVDERSMSELAIKHLESFAQVIQHALACRWHGIKLSSEHHETLESTCLTIKQINRDYGDKPSVVISSIKELEKKINPVIEYIATESRKKHSAVLREQYKSFVTQ